MRTGLLFLVLTFLVLNHTQAQNRTITGTLTDQTTKTPLSGATVRLKNITGPDYSKSTVSDSIGHFIFANLTPDSFLLSISYVGYNPINRRIKVDTTDITISIAAVPNTSSELETVVISTTISPVSQKADTIQYNASQFKVNPDASAEDLVKKMPGISVQNGQVTAHGENVQKVTIDGRELFGDDATAALRNLPAEVIDKIQVFDRLSDQAQFTGFDDGNTTKSINIITKANMRNGQFGRVFAGYGTDDRYQLGGNASLFHDKRRISIVGLFNNINQQNFSSQDLLGVTSSSSRGGGGGVGQRGGGGGNPRGGGGRQGGGQGGGNYGSFGNNSNFLVGNQNGINKTNAIGINYSDLWGSKITVSASYFFNNTNNNTTQISNLSYLDAKLPNRMDSSISNSKNYNHRFTVRFEYKIDSFNQLIINPNLAFQSNQTNRVVTTSTFLNNPFTQVSRISNATNSNTSGNNLNNTILFRHAFHKKGRTFSVNLNTSYNQKNGDVYTKSLQRFFDSTGNFLNDSTSDRLTNQANNGYLLSANLAYTEPLGQKSQLQLNYNPSYSYSKADQEAYRFNETEDKYSIFDSTLSNKFNSTYIAQNAGIAFRHGDRDNQFAFGANYQHSQLSSDRVFPTAVGVNRSFDNLLPNAFGRFKLSSRSNLRIFYRASTNQPSVTQLQDVYDITNRPYITAGNPFLKPQYNHTLSTRYTFTNTSKGLLFVANIFAQGANNYIANGIYVPLKDSFVNKDLTILQGEQLTKPLNMNGYWNFRSYLTFAVPVKWIKSQFNLNGGVTYNRLPGVINSATNVSKTLTYSVGSVIASNISQYVDFTVSYSANFNTVRNQNDPTLNDNYFQHLAGVQLNLLSKSGWFFQNDLTNQIYTGLSSGFNQNYTIWNMSAGKKFLKNQKGELKVSVFDLLKQNKAIVRNVTESYIEDVQYAVLRQYFMLTFTYNLRNFGTPAKGNNNSMRSRNFGGM